MLKSIPILLAVCLGCNKQPNNSNNPTSYPIVNSLVNEASGIADSQKNPGFLWVQEDSNTPAQITLITHKGEFVKHIPIKGIANRDWEDMIIAKGPKPDINYIYIAETGDNNAQYKQYAFHRFPEPAANATEISTVETIPFQYPDGSHDAEAFLADPLNNDLYIITKREKQSLIYLLKAPYSLERTNTLTLVGELPYNFVVSAGVTADQKGIAIKTYDRIYYYQRNQNETLKQVLAKNPGQLNYLPEIQGEAFCFTNNNLGYYTLSERVSSPVTLFYYKR